MKQKHLLILTATHGDEDFSIPIIESLSRKYGFDWEISNPRALKLKKRFVDIDLNRSAPGNPRSKFYEEKRANQIIKLARTYDYVIDIHGTASKTGIFIIISNPDWKNIEFAKKFDVDDVVLWPGLMPTGPLTQFIPNSIEIECGPKSSKDVGEKLEKILGEYLSSKRGREKQNFYIVTGKFTKNPKRRMFEFKKFTYGDISFYPLLINQYPGIKCYMMQKLRDTL